MASIIRQVSQTTRTVTRPATGHATVPLQGQQRPTIGTAVHIPSHLPRGVANMSSLNSKHSPLIRTSTHITNTNVQTPLLGGVHSSITGRNIVPVKPTSHTRTQTAVTLPVTAGSEIPRFFRAYYLINYFLLISIFLLKYDYLLITSLSM